MQICAQVFVFNSFVVVAGFGGVGACSQVPASACMQLFVWVHTEMYTHTQIIYIYMHVEDLVTGRASFKASSLETVSFIFTYK